MSYYYGLLSTMVVFIFLSIFLCLTAMATFDTYIVHVSLPDGDEVVTMDRESWHQSFVKEIEEDSNEGGRIIYSYKHVVNGFAARLSDEEIKVLEKKEGFLYARPQKMMSLQTTHSPSFLGLEHSFGVWERSHYGENVIIGIIDAGITPNHPSFSDEGMSPPPAKWKGKCELKSAACNNKLIGVRNFVDEEEPLDTFLHGTACASVAAGNYVKNANVYGNANGTAVGMAPLAHLAMYKVCNDTLCSETGIIAGMDAAVEDGVDVISLSVGTSGGFFISFWNETFAIGAYAAMKKGIFVSSAAGNSGPLTSTISVEAPWILSVGASTIDRSIRATAVLGNNVEYDGESAFQPHDSSSELLPLVYFNSRDDDINATYCAPGSLNDIDVQGKIVLCERGGNISRISKGQAVKDAGGLGMILMCQETDGYTLIIDVHVLPVTLVSYAAGEEIKAYINSTSFPKAKIVFKGTILGVKNAPSVASLSSRGPSLSSPGVLKPDIIGPGVSILAASPFHVDNSYNTKSTFDFFTGTSVSCPHLSGIAALLKSAHPHWSPAAIKSAIMTTADVLNHDGTPILDERLLPADIFAIGAGHVNPSRAYDPGLVYDLQPDDYIPYLCGLGYTDIQIELIIARKIKCSEITSIEEAELNYPSFAVKLGSNEQKYNRTLTNVGESLSSYHADLQPIPGVDVFVQPSILNFREENQKISYQISFRRLDIMINEAYVQGSISWVSDHHVVSSPISIKLSD